MLLRVAVNILLIVFVLLVSNDELEYIKASSFKSLSKNTHFHYAFVEKDLGLLLHSYVHLEVTRDKPTIYVSHKIADLNEFVLWQFEAVRCIESDAAVSKDDVRLFSWVLQVLLCATPINICLYYLPE